MKLTIKVSGGNVLNKFMILLSLLILSGNTWSQENEVTEDELFQRIKQAMQADMNLFLDEMTKIDKLTETYLQNRQDQCSGEFSSFVINEKGEKVLKRKKLNRNEKNQCLLMVIEFRRKITGLMFKARKTYLQSLHLSQTKELEAMEKKALLELEKLAKQYK